MGYSYNEFIKENRQEVPPEISGSAQKGERRSLSKGRMTGFCSSMRP